MTTPGGSPLSLGIGSDEFFDVSEAGLELERSHVVAALAFGPLVRVSSTSGPTTGGGCSRPAPTGQVGIVRAGPYFKCGATFVRQPDCLLGRSGQ